MKTITVTLDEGRLTRVLVGLETLSRAAAQDIRDLQAQVSRARFEAEREKQERERTGRE